MVVVFITILSLSIIPQNTNLPDYSFRDTFGYYYLDSDTTAPNAPVFNWVSVYNRGTRITGLADDNVKGPFPLGFNFKYYWAGEANIYINSNGSVSFSDDFLSAYPFQNLPSCKRPNNIIAPLMADLDFSVGNPSCWYWTNASDTFIVEFDSVHFWSTGGLATFQVILCRTDSSITFQYLTVQGGPSGTWSGANSNSVGIENSIGNIGVQYLKDGLPAQNLLHDNLAIKFFKSAITPVSMRDAMVVNSMNKQSGAIFLHPNDSLNIWTRVKNSGNYYEDWYPVIAKITDEQDSIVYFDIKDLTCRLPGIIDSVILADTWLPATTGRYCLNVQTALTSDICRSNDTMQIEINVIPNNANLQYEIGANASYSWNRQAGFANQFTPPSYPWPVQGAQIYAQAAIPTALSVKVYDDNGPNNTPGDVLAQTVINISSAQWYDAAFPTASLTINDGSYYIGAIANDANQLSFGMDTLPPFSHELWEYTGTWNLSRFSLNRDACIRSLAVLGTEEVPSNNIVLNDISILPNPFSNFTIIRLTNPLRVNKTVRIYNTSGILVRNFITRDETVVWDGKNRDGIKLANGCYFVYVDNKLGTGLRKVIITR